MSAQGHTCPECGEQFRSIDELEFHCLSLGAHGDGAPQPNGSTSLGLAWKPGQFVGGAVGKLRDAAVSVGTTAATMGTNVANIRTALNVNEWANRGQAPNEGEEKVDEAALMQEMERIREESRATCITIFR